MYVIMAGGRGGGSECMSSWLGGVVEGLGACRHGWEAWWRVWVNGFMHRVLLVILMTFHVMRIEAYHVIAY